jgi:hypothetical protein
MPEDTFERALLHGELRLFNRKGVADGALLESIDRVAAACCGNDADFDIWVVLEILFCKKNA